MYNCRKTIMESKNAIFVGQINESVYNNKIIILLIHIVNIDMHIQALTVYKNTE